MKSIPNNKLPHHLRTRSGGAKARNFRQNIVKSGEITPRAKRLHQSPDPTVAEAKSRTKPKEQRKGYRFSSINLISIQFCLSQTPEAFAPLFLRVLTQILSYSHSFVCTYHFINMHILVKPPPSRSGTRLQPNLSAKPQSSDLHSGTQDL